ncbi:uncharacterized protein LOC101853330 [Aplysia californica]|uniref:Uncharacterized protein LOC101853330 n=1 Tax=Aplysia californica TaxID=6500 RepID=A0ABM0JUU7_APLCA|nr:uncharacterized protein LOC101853330 [Aplysia californica]
MPKRPNPFGDHSSLQLKTHVRAKEVDQGVDQQVRMQSVYERTQKLLFGGMNHGLEDKRPPLDGNDNLMLNHFPNHLKASEPTALRQMHLGKNCELVNVDEEEMEEEESDNVSPPSVPGIVAQGYRFNECGQFSLARPGFSFCRTPAELSPPQQLPLPSACETFTSNGASVNTSAPNVFQRMRMAQMKKPSEEARFGGACHNCRRPVQSRDVLKCQFCENFVCGTCSRQCRGCLQHFCQLCSVLNYEQSTERAFCLTCSGR